MITDINNLIDSIKQLGAAHAAPAKAADIQFSEQVREMCKQNVCGKYGTNWMCPPAVGPLDDLKKNADAFEEGVVFQTIHHLTDSFDYEGMLTAKSRHDEVFQQILAFMRKEAPTDRLLALNAGSCEICSKCTYKDGGECRFPDRAIPSLEAYGINVVALAHHCGIPYHNGQNTVTYFGLILYR